MIRFVSKVDGGDGEAKWREMLWMCRGVEENGVRVGGSAIRFVGENCKEEKVRRCCWIQNRRMKNPDAEKGRARRENSRKKQKPTTLPVSSFGMSSNHQDQPARTPRIDWKKRSSVFQSSRYLLIAFFRTAPTDQRELRRCFCYATASLCAQSNGKSPTK